MYVGWNLKSYNKGSPTQKLVQEKNIIKRPRNGVNVWRIEIVFIFMQEWNHTDNQNN